MTGQKSVNKLDRPKDWIAMLTRISTDDGGILKRDQSGDQRHLVLRYTAAGLIEAPLLAELVMADKMSPTQQVDLHYSTAKASYDSRSGPASPSDTPLHCMSSNTDLVSASQQHMA